MKDKLKAKVKLPHIDEADFPYKFYKCWWRDIISSENWEDLTAIKKSKPAICITMGWLVSTKNNNYVFVGDLSFNDDETITQGGNTTVIPKTNVLKLKEIKNI